MLCKVAVGYIFLFIFSNLVRMFIYPNKTIFRKYVKIEYICFIFAMAIVAYSFIPSVSDDLYRHLRLVYKIMNKREYDNNMFVFVFFARIAAYFKDEHLLPFMIVLLNVLFWWKSIKSTGERISVRYKDINIYLWLSFGMVGGLAFFSGLRNALVFSIANYLFQKRLVAGHVWAKWDYMLWLLCVFIHPSIIVPFVIFLFSDFILNNKLLRGLLLFWSVLTPFVLKILSTFPFRFFQYLYSKAQVYTSGVSGLDDRIFWAKYLCVLFLIIVLLILKSNIKCELREYYNYLLCLCYFVIGSFYFADFVNRFSMLVGYMLLPLICKINNKTDAKTLFINIVFLVFILGLNAYSYVSVFSHMMLPL